MFPTTAPLRPRDWAAAMAAVVIWGLNFVVMKWGLQGLSPMLLGALRFAVASLPFIAFVARPKLPWRWLALYGLVQGIGQFGLLFLGLSLGMTAGMASVVMQTQAFFTMLLAAPLLGERARPAQWLGLGIAAVGLALIGLAHGDGPGQMTAIGFLLTLGAAFMWAASNLVVRFAARVVPDYDPLGFIVWSSLVPVLPFTALALWQDGLAHTVQSLAGIGLREVFAVVFLALLATLAAYAMWTNLLKRYSAGRIVPLSLLIPVIGLWAALAAFGEMPAAGQWLGTGAVLLGLLVNQFGGRVGAWLGGRVRTAG